MLRDDDILEPILENLHMPELMEETILHSPAKEKHTEARLKLSMFLQIFVSVHDLGQVKEKQHL